VELAQLVVVIEGHAVPSALAPARYAQARGTILGAVPGQINSSLSGAPHTLLREGAALIGGAEDALELLHTGAEADATSLEMPRLALEPALQAVLDDVAAGRDSAQALSRHQQKPLEEVLLALTQLELMGLLARARGGRYMRRVGRAAGNRAAGS
jgi:DNA processing protein